MDPGESSIETVIHDIRLIVPDEEVCQNLFILPSHRVCYLERVRVWSGVPALFLQNYIPESVCPDLCRELQEVDLTKCSLYDTIEQKMGLCPSFAKRWVQPAIANPKVAAALLIEVGSPLFLVRNTTYDTHYQIRDFYRCYVTERYSRLEMTISRDARQGPNDNITADQGGTK
jgi:GntR family transcriptional regulator